MRATLTTVSVAALLAAGAGSAAASRPDRPIARLAGDGTAVAARPAVPVARRDAALHAQAMRSQTRHFRDTRTVASLAPATTVRVTRAPLADGGFDWADAGIGAGLVTVLLLSGAAVSVVRHQPRSGRA